MWTHQADYLLLASASPRRLQLLEQIQIPVKQLIVPVQDDDEPRLDGETVIDYVTRTARDKLERAQAYWSTQHTNQPLPPILTADTTVAIGEVILGKPTDKADAKRILTTLAGHTHNVYTAVTLLHHNKTHATLTQTKVDIDGALVDVIEDYIATGEPFGKAGAYAVQGIAAAYVARIEGSYSGVVGLPIYETTQLLRQAGLFR